MPWDSQTKVLFFHFSQSPRVSPSKHKNTDSYKRKKQRKMQIPKQMWNVSKQKWPFPLFQKFTFLGWTVNANLQHKFKIKTEAICHLSFLATNSMGSYLQLLHHILVSWVTTHIYVKIKDHSCCTSALLKSLKLKHCCLLHCVSLEPELLYISNVIKRIFDTLFLRDYQTGEINKWYPATDGHNNRAQFFCGMRSRDQKLSGIRFNNKHCEKAYLVLWLAYGIKTV